MKLIGTLAFQAFDELSLENQHQLLLAYVTYVEGMIEQDEQPLLFLEWFLTTDNPDETGGTNEARHTGL